ncbi:MAG: hypothetical protein LUF90_02210 [Rikenellaceae bacterium]|nr:hypothetical protein [Rikenellaceae bacterium]
MKGLIHFVCIVRKQKPFEEHLNCPVISPKYTGEPMAMASAKVILWEISYKPSFTTSY